MRAVRPNSVTSATTVSLQAVPMLLLIASSAPLSAPKQLRQPTVGDAFVEMRIPAIERERADTRSVRPRQEFRCGTGDLSEVSTHLARATPLGFRTLSRRMLDRGQFAVVLEHARQFHIGMPIKVEQALRGVGACRLYPLR